MLEDLFDKNKIKQTDKNRVILVIVALFITLDLCCFAFRWLTELWFLIITDDDYVQGDIAEIAQR